MAKIFKQGKIFFIFFTLTFFSSIKNSNSLDGKQLFLENCITCHAQGKNIIIPEKNLKQEALEANGMNTISAITYQVLNGKNGMPAFDGRLTETEIEQIANYVIQESTK